MHDIYKQVYKVVMYESIIIIYHYFLVVKLHASHLYGNVFASLVTTLIWIVDIY